MTANELCRILIVDDEILIRQGIKYYLNWEEEGFQIVGEASNGKEALELIDQTNPHIVITDIVMPIMDGEELTKEIKANYQDIEVIILSSFGEYDYVRSTFQSGVVDYILKPKLDAQGLLTVLKRAREKIPLTKSTKNTIEDSILIGQAIEKQIKGYETDVNSTKRLNAFPYSSFCLIAVDTNGVTDNQTSMRKIVDDLKTGSITSYRYQLEPNLELVLLNYNKGHVPEVVNRISQIEKTIPQVAIILSDVFSAFSKVGKVFREDILPMLQYRFYFPEKTFLQKSDLPMKAPTCDAFNLDRFTDDFTHERFDLALTYVREYTKTYSTCYTTDVARFKSFFGNIIFNISILLGNMEYDVKELESMKYESLQIIEEAKTADKVVEQFNMFIEEFYKCIKTTRNYSSNSNMKMILEYIQDHYAEPLTLTEVATYFHFNPSYLSNYFSVHNKEGFIEYLNKIRIEEAAKLLIKSDIPISEIGPMVGYSDHSYFSKIFKKIKGMSPSQYRRKSMR
ncbi:response regulator transcription factor [Bacillus sp. REN16]|uniref:response regulator transcription factor n=1 Tax=Bacillus sp. REN16 TaxID=2887296 RepID=UPI001E4C5D48|nr:response regulator transcription factor [Bacillus sp. REN16]MCC3355313.1 response regulator transcription factor [Bacillus sp. REN16]